MYFHLLCTLQVTSDLFEGIRLRLGAASVHVQLVGMCVAECYARCMETSLEARCGALRPNLRFDVVKYELKHCGVFLAATG